MQRTIREDTPLPPMMQFRLDLPEVRVRGTEMTDRGEVLSRVESTLEGAPCRRCGRDIRDFHGYDRPLRLRHLPILDRRVFIEIEPKRYRCPYCEGNPTTTQRCAWYTPNRPHTKAYEKMVLRELINSTLTDVSSKQGIGEEAIEGILDRYIATSVEWEQVESVGRLGLDEIALKKGHRDYVVIVTARGAEGRVGVLGVLADRHKERVKAFLASIPLRVKKTITRVCTDMYEGYVRAAQEELPNAEVVVDRFHVAKGYRACADQMRKKELQRLKQEVPQTEYEKLQGLMWTFRKNATELDDGERQRLEQLFSYTPQLQAAYALREELTTIFETASSKVEATRAIEEWQDRVRASGLSCFQSFLTTLDNWKDEITNYFLDRETSGFVEGLNNKIKVLKRRCYGIFNVAHLFQRIHLDLEGYRLFGCS